MRTGILTGTLLIMMLAISVSSRPAAAGNCDDIEAKIAVMKTAADHEAIAACYDDMAKDAQAKATEHEQMRAAYRKAGGVGALKGLNMPQHCDYFIKTFKSDAKMYEEMAAEHRKMAKSAK